MRVLPSVRSVLAAVSVAEIGDVQTRAVRDREKGSARARRVTCTWGEASRLRERAAQLTVATSLHRLDSGR
jgi:hypothetical protein